MSTPQSPATPTQRQPHPWAETYPQCEANARRCADCREYGVPYDYQRNRGCIWGSTEPERRGNNCFARYCDPRRDAACQEQAAHPCDGSETCAN